MTDIALSGTGLFTPPESISNEELVDVFNAYVRRHNAEHAQAIAAGDRPALQESSAEFIEKASGIRSRYVMNRSGILDIDRMCPVIEPRPDDQPSILCDMSVAAARDALAQAGRAADEVDLVVVACSNLQRAYPAIAVEVQRELGCGGYAYDMNVACSSATFGIHNAANAIQSGQARRALVINPEICSGHLDFRDRDSHFIFGDACTATVVEPLQDSRGEDVWQLVDAKLLTQFSNNIRNNFGFLLRTAPDPAALPEQLFTQQGRKVFKEVVPLVANLIRDQLQRLDLEPSTIQRFWLHQANLSMNLLIAKRVLGQDSAPEVVPTSLHDYANTSSAGSVICFHNHRSNLPAHSLGVLCSFGAGYSVGSLLLRKQ